MKVMTFWDFMPYGIIDKYQHFRESLSTNFIMSRPVRL